VRKGSKVFLWVSKGSRFVQVPNVRNLPESRARRELEGMGLVVMDAVEERRDAEVPLGYVIGTVPPAGARTRPLAPRQTHREHRHGLRHTARDIPRDYASPPRHAPA
jgi:beta-lactam-binding protein with PASTA domain